MENFNPESERISRYLLQKMTPEEAASFDRQLTVDQELKEEVDFRRLVMESVQSLGNDQLRESIKTSIKNFPDEQPLPKRAKFRFLKSRVLTMVASLLLLLALGGLWYANQTYSNATLFADNFELPIPDFTRGDNSNQPDLFEKVMNAYSANDYNAAIALLASVPPSPEYNKAQFHLGHLYLKTKQSENAISVFQGLIERGDVRYDEEGEWLLVLAHLQHDQPEKGREYLDHILQNPGHEMHNKALALQKKMNNFWRKLGF